MLDKAKNWSVCPASRSGAIVGSWWLAVVVHGHVKKKKKKKGFLFLGSRHARRPIHLPFLCSGYPPGHWEWISAVVDVAVNGRLTSRPLETTHPFPNSPRDCVGGHCCHSVLTPNQEIARCRSPFLAYSGVIRETANGSARKQRTENRCSIVLPL